MSNVFKLACAVVFVLNSMGGCVSSNDRSSRGDRGIEVDKGTSRRVPDAARIVDEGRGESLNYIARNDGIVYLVDDSVGVVVWDGRVRDGDHVRVNPDKDRIEINGKEQAGIDLKKKDRFRLYFLRR